jgi:hypothetical protein
MSNKIEVVMIESEAQIYLQQFVRWLREEKGAALRCCLSVLIVCAMAEEGEKRPVPGRDSRVERWSPGERLSVEAMEPWSRRDDQRRQIRRENFKEESSWVRGRGRLMREIVY